MTFSLDEKTSTVRACRSTDDADEEACAHRAFVVEVVQGRERGLRVVLDPAEPALLVGQSFACAVRLTDPEVSRRHLSLEAISSPGSSGASSSIRITDLDSTNGSSVNGVSIGVATLRGGEMIGLGQTVLRVEPATQGQGQRRQRHHTMRFGGLIGKSPQMRRLYPLCERLAASDVPIVIEGETGTGKEVLAEAIHQASPRADAPFVIYDCTAVPPNLVESALFGHEKGAFTGATSMRKGVFEQAHGGTLFIDEIGELDLSLQPKLLRALQKKEVQRVGGSGWLRVDVRVISATRRDLDREVAAGRFRDDLFFRLAVGRVELPPLRHRTGDVALLARHFLRDLGGDERLMPPNILARLCDYAWPGNVRELENSIARTVALGELSEASSSSSDRRDDDEAEPPLASGELAKVDSDLERVLALDLPLTRARQVIVEEFERRYVERVLARSGGNVARAARASGLARRYFQILRAKRTP